MWKSLHAIGPPGITGQVQNKRFYLRSKVNIWSDLCVCPHLLSGDASLLPDHWGHPGGLGSDAVLSGHHAGQRWITGPTTGPAQSLDVEFDPGERPPPFPEPSWRERCSTSDGREGHQWSHLPGPRRRPASQELLILVGPLTDGCLPPDGTRKTTTLVE